MSFYPDENSWWNDPFTAEVRVSYENSPTQPRTFPVGYDFSLFKWYSRPGFTIGEGLPWNEAKTRVLRELEESLGIPEQPIDGGPWGQGSYPDENSWWNDFTDAVIARYLIAGRDLVAEGIDFSMFKWFARTGYDIGRGASPDASMKKHIYGKDELRDQLGYSRPIPPVVQNPNKLEGDTVIHGRVISVGGVPRIHQYCHAMDLFSRAVHGHWDEVEDQLRVIAQYYAGIRFCDNLGYWDKNRPGDPTQWSAWAGKEVNRYPFVAFSGTQIPATPNYDAQLERFLLLVDSFGLRVMHDRGDLNSLSLQQKLVHMRLLGTLYARLGDTGRRVLGGLWACNEAWQNGGEDIQVLNNMILGFKEGSGGWLPAVVGLSAPGGSTPDWFMPGAPQAERDANWGSEMPQSFIALSGSPATVMTCHGARDVRNIANMLEHYFGYGYDSTIRNHNKPFWNTEPVGGGDGVSVGELNDVEALCGVHLEMLITGQISTFMSGAGVFGKGRIEDMPGFYEVARLSTFLPQDIATFQTVIHAGANRPFSHKSILVANDPTRFDQAISNDGRFCAVWHTVETAPKPLMVQRSCSEFKVIDPVTGDVEFDGVITAGQAPLTHNGKVRLVVGRLA